jgi:hypothetical protein
LIKLLDTPARPRYASTAPHSADAMPHLWEIISADVSIGTVITMMLVITSVALLKQ